MNFFSQYGEDAWIAKNLVVPELGFYVDVGAAHPKTLSNTAFLRERRWRGVCIDANPRWAHEWETVERCDFIVAIVNDDPLVRFDFTQDPVYSRVNPLGKTLYATTTLDRLLCRYREERIDFLNVDVEGQEAAVLRSLNFPRWRPRIVVAEYNTLGMALHRMEISDFMMAMVGYGLNYHLVFETPCNLIFKRTEDPS